MIRKIATREGASFVKYIFAGLPPVAAAAFLPNAMGMSCWTSFLSPTYIQNPTGMMAMHVAAELNKIVEDPSLDDGWNEPAVKAKGA